MAWCQPGDKPLSEPMMVSLLMHICDTWAQWINPKHTEPEQSGQPWGRKEMDFADDIFKCIHKIFGFFCSNFTGLCYWAVEGPIGTKSSDSIDVVSTFLIGSGSGLAPQPLPEPIVTQLIDAYMRPEASTS